MNCGCGSKVEEARAELGLKICRSCAFSGDDVPRPKGMRVWDHKTGGEIQIMSASTWENNKQYLAVGRTGRSVVKRFSKNTCS